MPFAAYVLPYKADSPLRLSLTIPHIPGSQIIVSLLRLLRPFRPDSRPQADDGVHPLFVDGALVQPQPRLPT